MRKVMAALVTSTLLAGCGGGSKPKVTFGLTAKTPAACGQTVPLGRGRMGVCVPRSSSLLKKPLATTLGGVLGADVSSFQGCPSMAGLRFVIFKVGEGKSWADPTRFCHAVAAKARHIPWGVYYFQRPGDQVAQAQRFVALTSSLGNPPMSYTIDSEVGVSTAETCQFARALHSLVHRAIVIYTAPGLWPGGESCGALLWVADYNVRFVLPSGFSHALAWQFTDGKFGPLPHALGGLAGDLDQDLGLIAATRQTAPPASAPRVLLSRRFRLPNRQTASERGTWLTWTRHECKHPARRSVCRSSAYHAQLLVNRIDYVTHHPLRHHKPTYGLFHRGQRRAILAKIS